MRLVNSKQGQNRAAKDYTFNCGKHSNRFNEAQLPRRIQPNESQRISTNLRVFVRQSLANMVTFVGILLNLAINTSVQKGAAGNQAEL